MSTATYHVTAIRNKGAVMVTQQLTHELQAIVEDLYGLKALAATTGFMTFKSQREILSRLTPSEQAAVGRALAQREQDGQKK